MESVSKNNPVLEAAVIYTEAGFPVVPMQIFFEKPDDLKAKKRPSLLSWMEFQNRLPTEEEIKRYFQNPDGSIAIITGKISNLVVIDIDNGASEDRIRFFNSFSTLKVKTPSGGEHHYYRIPKGVSLKSRADILGNSSHIDIRGEGGLIIAPPSKYPNGIAYEWKDKFDVNKIAELPALVLRVIEEPKRGQKQNNDIQIVRGVEEGSRNASAASLVGKLLKYLPPWEWDPTALPLVEAWNGTNNPPLLPDELLRTYESIKGLESLNKKEEKASLDIGLPISLFEMLKSVFLAAKFAVDELFESATINMLSAPPNKWKSWLVLLCAISLASGRNFLGKFKTEKQAVLIVNEEDPERLLQERCNMLMEQEEELPIYFYIGKGIVIEESFITQLIDRAKNLDVKFIIFDSLRSVHRADENSSKEMQEVMEQFKRIIREDITVLFTHHNRKKSRSVKGGDDWGEESRGSSAINAALHGHLSCEEIEKDGKNYLVITQAKLKGAAKIPRFGVSIEKREDKMIFTYDGEYKGNGKSIEIKNDSVLKAIEKSEKWLGIKDLVEMGFGRDTAIRAVVKRLEGNNQIQSKERKNVLSSGFSAQNQDGAPNEKMYFRFAADFEFKGPAGGLPL